jgi:hypothetical protein
MQRVQCCHEHVHNIPETDAIESIIATTILWNTYDTFSTFECFLLQILVPVLLEMVHFLVGIKYCWLIQSVIE